MIFYFAMVNAWSLLGSIVNGTFEKDYPLMDKKEVKGSESYESYWGEKSEVNTAHEEDGLDYENDYYDQCSGDDYMADIDDQRAHHFMSANSSYNDGWTQEYHQKELEKMDFPDFYEPKRAHFYKYHEEEILKDIEEYVSSTYQGHYTGKSHEYRNVQTIDLMASKELAASFCQANILKYGSRYGNKDGKNKKDLMKVIHYAMLLLHFDNHYGEPSMPSGNFEQMP
jgi:hypothetical protein